MVSRSVSRDRLSATELLRLIAPEGSNANDRLSGLVCVSCGWDSGALMVPIDTPGNPFATHVFVHEGDCMTTERN